MGIQNQEQLSPTPFKIDRIYFPESLKESGIKKAKQVLKEIGIEESFVNTGISSDIIQGLLPFMFDVDSVDDLPPCILNEDKYKKPKNIGLPSNETLKGLPVLSSIMAQFLVKEQKNRDVVWVDVDGTYAANQVSKLEGDRYLREIAMLLDKKIIGNKTLVKFGGDGFFIIRQRSGEELLQEKELSQEVDSLINEVNKYKDESRLSHFVFTGDEDKSISLAYNSFKKAKLCPYMLEKNIFYKDGKIEDRKKRLINLHPEIASLVDDILNKGEKLLSSASKDKLLAIIEGGLFDPVLQPVIDKENLAGKVRLFNDFRDMTEHLSKQQSNSKLIKIDISSVLKTANDQSYPKGGYLAANSYLEATFKAVVNELTQGDSVHSPLLKQVKMVRRWGDFYIAIPEEHPTADITKRLENFFKTHRYITISHTGSEADLVYNAELLEEPKASSNHNFSIPLIPAVQSTLLRLKRAEKDSTKEIMENYQRFNNEVERLDLLVQDKRLESAIKRLEGSFYKTDVEFIANKVLNPHDPKRGLPRLRQKMEEMKGLSQEGKNQIIRELSNCYRKKTDKCGKQAYVLKNKAGVRNQYHQLLSRFITLGKQIDLTADIDYENEL